MEFSEPLEKIHSVLIDLLKNEDDIIKAEKLRSVLNCIGEYIHHIKKLESTLNYFKRNLK